MSQSASAWLGMMADSNNLQETLKPFYQRASESEDRLAKLEAVVAGMRNSGNEESMKMVDDLQKKLEDLKAEKAAETKQVQKELQQLSEENTKLHYRITHLVRALKESDSKLMSK